MITAIVRYKPAQKLTADQVEMMMQNGANNIFKGIPGLYGKQFCFDIEAGLGLSVYLWESKETAKRFFNETFVENFRSNLGCTPEIDYWPTIAMLDNRSGEVLPNPS